MLVKNKDKPEKTMRAYKYRIYPTKPQKKYIDETIHLCWWFYRYVLHHYQDDRAQGIQNLYKWLPYCYQSIAYHPNWFDLKPVSTVKPVKPEKVKKSKKKALVPVEQKLSEYETWKRGNDSLKEQCEKMMLHWSFHGKIGPGKVWTTCDYKVPQNCYRNETFHPVDVCYPMVDGSPGKSDKNRRGSLRSQGKGDLSTYKLISKARIQRPELNRLPAIVLQEVLERVDSAYQKFFKGGGYPKFPKDSTYSSITWTQLEQDDLIESEGLIKLSKFPKYIKINYHRPVTGKIKRANISRDDLGQYFISLMCNVTTDTIEPRGDRIIGIDFGVGKKEDPELRSFLILSNGIKIDTPMWDARIENGIARVSRKMARHPKGSPTWLKYKRWLNHLYDDRNNQKDYWVHNITSSLAKDYDYIVIEDLDLTKFHEKRKDPVDVSNKKLKAERSLRKAFTEVGLSEVVWQLSYKLPKGHLVKVDPAFTTQACNCCGYVNDPPITLSVRRWVCPHCHEVHDRDVNAARNILKAGLAVINNPIKIQPEITMSEAGVV